MNQWKNFTDFTSRFTDTRRVDQKYADSGISPESQVNPKKYQASHISGINNIRYIVSSPVYKGRGVVPRDLLQPPPGGSKKSLGTTRGWY